ncbi:MAG: ABC-2 family transporter protein [Ruminococcus sp.]|jgi:ABC-2 type transport system permease protein|nr:ABC-2 family transporter protein [Ruminococcus sp.]
MKKVPPMLDVLKSNKYIKIMRMSFSQSTVFRASYFFGLVNSIISVFITVSIWKALYGGAESVDGISFSATVTNIVFSMLLSTAFGFNDFAIAGKVHSGAVASELLKPMSISLSNMFQAIGSNLFKLIGHFAPTLIISAIFFKLLPPKSFAMLLLAAVSVIFGFCLLYSISYIVSVTSFWITNVWSLSTLKNVIIGIFAGTMLPIWFMPQSLQNALRYTPFDVIYFAPVKIYLGQMTVEEIAFSFGKQLFWLGVFILCGALLWRKGVKKIVIAGG